MRTFLRAKIHRGTVTGCDLEYEGSCGLGPELLEVSGIRPLERIGILNITNGARLETYALLGQEEGEITLNGAAAHLADEGDQVIIVAYESVEEKGVDTHKARIVLLGERNAIVSVREDSTHLL
ncbi:aspartate 1-decarboxylase [bacterium]|nr:aspartate 1-decarboxylase [bacterium]